MPFELNIGDTPLTCEQQACLIDVIYYHTEVFSLFKGDLGFCDILKHSIPTTTDKPVYLPHRQIPVGLQSEVRKCLDSWLKQGIIRPSKSPYASQVVIVCKKTGEIRLCVNFRKLNAISVRDSFQLPRVEKALQAIQAAVWFSSFDLAQGYLQMAMEEEDIEKTAFCTGSSGLYEFTRMPFGPMWACPFADLWKCVLGTSNTSHYPKKGTTMKYVSSLMLADHSDLRQNIPKGEMKKSNLPEFQWTPVCQEGFDQLKKALTEAPVLAYLDYSKPFILETDASLKGLGAVLSQKGDNNEIHVISYASRSLRPSEKKMRDYSSAKIELMALKWNICDKFKDYLLESKFTVFTDNNPLCYVKSSKLGAAQICWLNELALYDFDIVYHTGKSI